MDSIVKKLSEIESAAVAIVANTDVQKKVLEKEFEEKRQQFEQELTASTNAQIAQIHTKLDMQLAQALEQHKSKNIAATHSIKKEFDTHHKAYAAQILQRIIEV